MRSRISLLARQALLQMRLREKNLIISEPIVYDGFESFQYSQFEPCYINNAVGKVSHFQYDLNYSPLNRKGRMNFEQKKKQTELIKKYGKFPTNAIQVQTTKIFERLLLRSGTSLLIHMDEHKAYARSIRELEMEQKKQRLTAALTSSKEVRDGKNNLFAINRLHNLYREHTAAHKRETCAFQKNEAGLMDRMIVFQAFRNYMSSTYCRNIKRRKDAAKVSPAMTLKIECKILGFNQLFHYKLCMGQAELNEDDRSVYFREWGFARRKIREYRE